MCVPDGVLARPRGASVAVLIVRLMEYPLPGPVVALLSQEKAALAPKSYLISSCKKSIKITLVYAKDQHSEDSNPLPAAVTSAAAAAAMPPAASTSKASSASSLMSSSSSLSSSAERKKPRHAGSSSKQARKKKKKKGKSSRRSSRSTPSGLVIPRVTKLSESSTSLTSEPDIFCSGRRGGSDVGGGGAGGRGNLAPGESVGYSQSRERDEESCSTPEFPLLFGGHDGEMVGRARMSTVDSGVPSSNGTLACDQTAESDGSEEDCDVIDTLDRQLMTSAPVERVRTGAPKATDVKTASGSLPRSLPVDLPRRGRGISDSSISSLSSSDDDEKGRQPAAVPRLPNHGSRNKASAAPDKAAPTSLLGLGAQTPIRREDQWQTWTRIPRTQAPPTSARQKLTATPSVSSRPATVPSNSGAVGGAVDGAVGGVVGGAMGGTSRPPVDQTARGVTGGTRTNQNEGGASWDGAENL
ncbi:hypothetical protein EGW08_008275 [Elysia chlorotica]|uniref:Uncharacterized protein n=1 Tax=Elysia chlorotica TaxID=188477 RepID=A0A433TQT3_ELYCH|nr:hypothetical protein EGW08_008275 [Elysia chlorotica]